MVHEDQIPDIRMLGASLAKLVEPRRPLKPVRKERKKATTQSLTDGSVHVLINVIRGYNLPVRRPGHTATGTTSLGSSVARRLGGKCFCCGRYFVYFELPNPRSWNLCHMCAV